MREMAEAEKGVYPARCPFCGSEGATLMDLTDGTVMAWVKCLSCRAEGPKRESGAEAVAAWNEAAARCAHDGLDAGIVITYPMKTGYVPNTGNREGCRPAEPAEMEDVRRRFDELEAKLSTYFATAEAAAIEAKKAGWNEAVDNIARTIKAANNQGEGNPLIERLADAILELKQ